MNLSQIGDALSEKRERSIRPRNPLEDIDLGSPWAKRQSRQGPGLYLGQSTANYLSQVDNDHSPPSVPKFNRMNSQRTFARGSGQKVEKLLTAKAQKNLSRAELEPAHNVNFMSRIRIAPFGEEFEEPRSRKQTFEMPQGKLVESNFVFTRKESKAQRTRMDNEIDHHDEDLALDRSNNLYLRLHDRKDELNMPVFPRNRRDSEPENEKKFRVSLIVGKEKTQPMYETEIGRGKASRNPNVLRTEIPTPKNNPESGVTTSITDRYKKSMEGFNNLQKIESTKVLMSLGKTKQKGVFDDYDAGISPPSILSPKFQPPKEINQQNQQNDIRNKFKPIKLFDKKNSLKDDVTGKKITFGAKKDEPSRSVNNPPPPQRNVLEVDTLSEDSDQLAIIPPKQNKSAVEAPSKINKIFERATKKTLQNNDVGGADRFESTRQLKANEESWAGREKFTQFKRRI